MDFRIDFERGSTSIAPSHANIVADIYNKVRNGKMPPTELRRTLVNLATTGEIDIERARAELRYNVVRPPEELKEEVRVAHGLKASQFYAEMNDRDSDSRKSSLNSSAGLPCKRISIIHEAKGVRCRSPGTSRQLSLPTVRSVNSPT